MGDECVEMLANEVANLASSVSSQQQTLKELQEMIAALHARLDHIAGNRNGNHGESSHRQTNYGSTGLEVTFKLDFPRFNGRNDPTSWICRQKGEITWANLKEGLYARYGPMEFDDNFGDLTKLKQIGTVREYEGYFERLLSRRLRVGRLPPSQQVGCFISGLKLTTLE
uniref:Retrotransposon gag domain-containing protein n=1 Tax=Fagus sylvatica TaxID=28930 RepID=A0A2N9EDY9_FAGSY